jgi:biopolymer transport protein TolR
VVIDKSAQVFLGDQPIELPALAESLKKTADASKDTEVQLRSDESVPYGKVIEVIGIAQKAGLTRIGFVANPKP